MYVEPRPMEGWQLTASNWQMPSAYKMVVSNTDVRIRRFCKATYTMYNEEGDAVAKIQHTRNVYDGLRSRSFFVPTPTLCADEGKPWPNLVFKVKRADGLIKRVRITSNRHCFWRFKYDCKDWRAIKTLSPFRAYAHKPILVMGDMLFCPEKLLRMLPAHFTREQVTNLREHLCSDNLLSRNAVLVCPTYVRELSRDSWLSRFMHYCCGCDSDGVQLIDEEWVPADTPEEIVLSEHLVTEG